MRILGIDIGGTNIKIGILNEYGEIEKWREEPTGAYEGGTNLMIRLIEIIKEYDNIDRIGISTAGQVDFRNGSIIYASETLPGWTGMKVKEILESNFHIPVVVDNDVNCAALAEAFYGAGKEENSFLCLTYGTGIGGAIIENKSIYRGAAGSSGEFGHIIIDRKGRECTCGGRGCYEAYASTTALVNRIKEEINFDEDINGRYIFEQIKEGNKTYEIIFRKWIEDIVLGLITLVHIYNPSLIVLGGGIMEQPAILDLIEKELKEKIMPNYRGVKLKSAVLGNKAGVFGAVVNSLRLEN